VVVGAVVEEAQTGMVSRGVAVEVAGEYLLTELSANWKK